MGNAKFQEAIQTLIAEINKKKVANELYRFKSNISYDEFIEVFKKCGNLNLLNKGIKDNFIIDENNLHVIKGLWLYLTNSDTFTKHFNDSNKHDIKYDLAKGILLVGAVGCGKSLIMQSFVQLIKLLNGRIIIEFSARVLVNCLINDYKLYKEFEKKPLFIDDIGKEKTTVNNYGTVESPLIELLSIRYDTYSLTFATSNYNLSDLGSIYGLSVKDRIIQMFNVIVLPGKSRRI